MITDQGARMHNVNVDAVEQTAAQARTDPAAAVQHVAFDGQWQTSGPQFRATIPVPNGEPVVFQADFPPPMGGTGAAPNPLASRPTSTRAARSA